MGIGYALGNVVLAPRAYENWTEVISTIIKRQEPAKIILKSGLTIEAEVGLRYLVREIFFKQVYNPPYLPIGEQDVVVDIGANNGVFTLFAASRTRKAVYAFEPAPRNLQVLQRNIAVNKLHHVTASGCAVSDTVGSANFLLNPYDGQQNLLSEHILPDKIEQYKAHTELKYLTSNYSETGTYIEVATTTLPEIMDSQHLERIDFLKLDCEGAEGTILRSTPAAYLQRVSKIALEFHDHLSDINHQELQKILQRAGFHTKLKWDNTSPLGYLYAWRS